ncbi:MAG: chromosomal replication initiator protein DnaA [Clostridia bacterium]|nr:chromosomal replication initiator protein DnaA [Clostridia bacterium]
MDELSGISEALREELQVKIGTAQSTFDLWFGDFNLTELSEDRAVFSTPTKLRRRILSAKYIDVIKSTLAEIIGFSVDVEIFALDEQNELNSPTEEEEEVTADISEEEREEIIQKEKKIEEMLNDTSGDKKTLLDEYTFENFIEGSSNKFAKAACYAVANDPCAYNPLFIHGHSGLGKTHLLYAIMNYMKKNHKGLKIVYKKSESFMNELIEAIGEGLTAPFKEKYRSADVLLLDDIQIIAGKEATQEEFFHTFNALYESEKQIILTSDRPPMEIKPLTDRLRTRFESGLIADVQPPSFELRVAIIRKKAEILGINVPPHLIDYMADRLNSNIRQIEGVLKKLQFMSSFSGIEITKEAIDQVISVVDPGNIPTDAMVERVLTAVAKKYGVTVEDLKSKKKTDSIAKARHVAVYVIRKLTTLSLDETGKIFGRDHTTALYSEQKTIMNIRTVKNFERDLNLLIKEIKGL